MAQGKPAPGLVPDTSLQRLWEGRTEEGLGANAGDFLKTLAKEEKETAFLGGAEKSKKGVLLCVCCLLEHL